MSAASTDPYRVPAIRKDDDDELLVADLTHDELVFWQAVFRVAMKKGHTAEKCLHWADWAVSKMRLRAAEK